MIPNCFSFHSYHSWRYWLRLKHSWLAGFPHFASLPAAFPWLSSSVCVQALDYSHHSCISSLFCGLHSPVFGHSKGVTVPQASKYPNPFYRDHVLAPSTLLVYQNVAGYHVNHDGVFELSLQGCSTGLQHPEAELGGGLLIAVVLQNVFYSVKGLHFDPYSRCMLLVSVFPGLVGFSNVNFCLLLRLAVLTRDCQKNNKY